MVTVKLIQFIQSFYSLKKKLTNATYDKLKSK